MSQDPSHDTRLDCPLDRPIAALRGFRARSESTLSPHELETLKEIETRLLRLADQYQELLHINARLMDADPLRIRTAFDPSSDSITFGVGDTSFKLKLRRADRNIPISQSGESAVGAYTPGSTSEEPEEVIRLKSRMETSLEGFYQSAHRVQKLVRTLHGTPNVESRALTIVRNKLVEHPDVGDFYTFGWSTNGPVVRPLHRPGREWVDSGLVPNTQEFAEVLARAFKKGAT